jgi:hypothetical protein
MFFIYYPEKAQDISINIVRDIIILNKNLCIFIVMSVYSYCMFMYLQRANWHSLATLTEVFPRFFLGCKANPRV